MAEKLCNGCMPDEELATHVIKKWQRSRVGDIAYWERRQKKEIFQEALDYYLATKKDVPERNKL